LWPDTFNNHFHPKTAEAAVEVLEQAGFRVGRMRMVRHSDWLRASAKLAGQARPCPPWQRWLASKPVSRLATWYCYLSQQADCIQVTAER
jgi:hypothetical protein